MRLIWMRLLRSWRNKMKKISGFKNKGVVVVSLKKLDLVRE